MIHKLKSHTIWPLTRLLPDNRSTENDGRKFLSVVSLPILCPSKSLPGILHWTQINSSTGDYGWLMWVEQRDNYSHCYYSRPVIFIYIETVCSLVLYKYIEYCWWAEWVVAPLFTLGRVQLTQLKRRRCLKPQSILRNSSSMPVSLCTP